VSHTVEVTAATPYEAVAQGLAAIRGNEWVAEIAEGFNVVKVAVADVRVEHEVKLDDFTKWVDRTEREATKQPLRSSIDAQRICLGFELPIKDALVGPHGPKIAIGVIEEVSVPCWKDGGYTGSACSSVCESTC
jgi:hypothetical protein